MTMVLKNTKIDGGATKKDGGSENPATFGSTCPEKSHNLVKMS